MARPAALSSFSKRLVRLGFHAFWLAAVGAVLVPTALTTGCGGPKYPSCDNDEHCTADGHRGVCVNHVCVECRGNEGCAAGTECKAGACAAIAGYCDDTHACAGGADCGTDHRCGAPKVAAREPIECDDEHVCRGSGERCQNGHCVAPPSGGPGCTDFPAPKFDFESPQLRAETREVLQRLAACLSTGSLKGRRVLLTGHCDARGEYEFNMGLGAERAEGVKTFLTGLGVSPSAVSTSSRGKLDAAGQDEAGWANDRRVDVEVR
jgi:hypothetical protein